MLRPSCLSTLVAGVLLAGAFHPGADLIAQETPHRPRVGIALSGGGARGIAHVGVLRVLEEHHVPIDVIGGTSMGAIVGGLYASGLSPDEIEAILLEVDWERALADKPARRSLDFRRREDGLRYPWEIEMGVDRSGLELPRGLIASQELGALLRRHTLHVANLDSFIDLPIPFVAVATDIGSGQAVVLRGDDLAEALRASMAIPLVFAPVQRHGRLLVDGGLVNNLPVDLVRSMGADIVIASDVSVQMGAVEEMRSLVEVLEQAVAIVSRTRVGEQIAHADLPIVPDLGDHGLFDFESGEVLIGRGEEAARSVAPQLDELALGPAAWDEYRHRRRRRPEPPDQIDVLRFKVPRWLDRRRLMTRVRVRGGESISSSRLAEEVDRLYALGEFERVDYSIHAMDDRTVVTIEAEEKDWGPNYIDFGLRLVTDSGGDDFRTGIVTFDAVVDLTRTRIGGRGAEWRSDIRFGQSSGAETEWYQPLDFGGRWFVAGGAGFLSGQQPVFLERRLVAEYGVDRGGLRVDLGRQIGRSGEVRLGLRRAWIDADVDAGSADLPSFDVDQAALVSRVVVDRLEDVSFPHKGVFLRLEALLSRAGLGSHRSYDRVELEAKGFSSAGRHTGFVTLDLGAALGSDLPAYDDFLVGGFLSLTGFGEDALRGDYAGVARIGYAYRLARIPPALRGVYLAAWAEGGSVWEQARDIDAGDLSLAGTVAIGADTGLGPAFLAYGAAENGDDRVYIALGTLF